MTCITENSAAAKAPVAKAKDALSKRWKRPKVKPDPRAQEIRRARREYLAAVKI